MAWDWLDDTLLGNSGETTDAQLRNPITSFNFVLEVEALYFLAVKTVKVFSKENEYEYIREGGVNDYVHMRRKPISKPFTFQVERYVGTERFLDPLANGTELALPVVLYVYRHKARNAVSEGAPAWPARMYTFTGCVVTNKEYGELNAEKGGLLTETTTIAYRELVVITNPTWGPDQELPPWEFRESSSDTTGSIKNKYAADSAVKINDTYYGPSTDTSIKGLVRKTVENDPTGKPRDAEISGDTPTWADSRNINNSDTYDITPELGAPYVHHYRKDKAAENKPKWDIKENKTNPKPKYANPKATSGDGEIYGPDEDGKTKRKDKNDVNKPKWDIKENKQKPKPKYAKPASNGDALQPPKEPVNPIEDAKPKYAKDTNAVSGDHYKKLDPGQGGWEQTDGKAKPRWDIRENQEDPKPVNADGRASEHDSDIYDKDDDGHRIRTDDAAKPKWDIKENKENPQPDYATPAENGDTPPPVMEPWDIRENETDPQPKYAMPAKNGDAPAPPGDPWDIKGNTDSPSPTHAVPAPNGDGKQPAKEPWDIKANTQDPHTTHSVPAKNGDGKQPAKEPWDIKANTKNPKPTYAKESPRDHEKPEAVKWPPTRRALMSPQSGSGGDNK